MLRLGPWEATTDRAVGETVGGRGIGAVEAEEAMEIVVAKAIEEADVPAESSGRDGGGGEGVADVMVAVSKGTLAVLPGLPPEDGGEGDEQRSVEGEVRRRYRGAELEGVVLG